MIDGRDPTVTYRLWIMFCLIMAIYVSLFSGTYFWVLFIMCMLNVECGYLCAVWHTPVDRYAVRFVPRENGVHFMLFIMCILNVECGYLCAVWHAPVDRYAVRFVPRENGVHFIHVRLNGNHIPGSPFRLFVGKQDADASLVRAYGDGLSHGMTGRCR